MLFLQATIAKEPGTIVLPDTTIAGITSKTRRRSTSEHLGGALIKFLLSRVVVVATALACTSLSAQSLAPAPNARQIRPKLPPGVHRPAMVNASCFHRRTVRQQVVRLHSSLDPYAMVMLPSGELKLTELAKIKPMSDPFVAAT